MLTPVSYKRFFSIFSFILPPTGRIVLLLSLMFLENSLALISPWLAGQFSDSILHNKSSHFSSYKMILLIWIIFIAGHAFISYYRTIVSGITSEKMVMTLRTRLYDHLQSLHLEFFHSRKHGKILSLISYDTTIISSFFSSTIIGLVPHVLTALGAFLCIFFISPLIAILIGFLIPILIIVTKLLGRRVRPISKELMKQYGSTFAIAEENLSTLPIIKTFTQERRESERFTNSSNDLFTITCQYLKAQSKLAPVIRFLSASVILLVLFFISDIIAVGMITTGEIVSTILYGMLLTRPLSSIADSYGQSQRALAAATRIADVFEEDAEDYSVKSTIPTIGSRIEFKGVSFGYADRKPLFENLSFTIDAGQTIAITGENGSGKSTIAHLLARLYKLESGKITIDDTDISEIDLRNLRSHIGFVQQQVLLKNASVRENLTFAKANASEKELLKATEAAHALAFIRQLPDGFNTFIGDQGVKLSGGQKQRLSLARALLKKPSLLILDEATAMFDPEGEKEFIKKNIQMLKDLTVIIITHRPATLALADKIYRLEDGKLMPQ